MDKTVLVERYASSSEQKILLSHLLDLMLRSSNRNIVTVSGFLSEAEAVVADRLLSAVGCKQYVLFGGYPEAERRCAVFFTDYCDADSISAMPALAELSFVEAKVSRFDAAQASFSHRDVLGALMGLGIERDVIGDIFTEGGTAVIVVKTSIAVFLREHLTKIGRYSVDVTAKELCDIKPSRDFEEGHDTVASMRLDAVVAAVFKTSRGTAVEAVETGLVAVNGVVTEKIDDTVKEGDKIAFRGKGKAVIDGTDGVSRKGRLRFRFRRYL